MKALSLWRPWPTLIMAYGKDIENRGWRPPRSLLEGDADGWFAIHAAQKVDPAGIATLMNLARAGSDVFAMDAEQAAGPTGIVGMARCDGWVTTFGEVQLMPRAQNGKDWRVSPWLSGPVGWALGPVAALRDPIPCRGQQGLWEVDGPFRDAMAGQLAWCDPCRRWLPRPGHLHEEAIT